MNNSNTQDLAVADSASNDVSILLGNGNGSFPIVKTVPLDGGVGPDGIAVGNFSNDGKQGLAVTDSNGEVTILSGDGAGNFRVSSTVSVADNGLEEPVAVTDGDYNGDGNLDLAVAGSVQDSGNRAAGLVNILQNNGSGGFNVVQNINLSYDVNQITTIKLNGSIFPNLAVSYSFGVALLINKGNGQFFDPVYYPLSGNQGFEGILAADFTGNGLSEIVVTNHLDSNLDIISGTTVGNFATFQPGSAILNELGTVQALQGGNPVNSGPINETSDITPSTSSPPDYLGYISLPYYPESAPLNIDSANEFLSVTPAEMQQSATSDTGSHDNYAQSGSIITGWDLFDGNGNPIAASTLQALNPELTFNNVLLDLGLPGYVYNAAHKVVGATDASDAVSADGQTIDLPGGKFGTLTLLGTAASEAKEQKFTVTYTDGTKQTITQSMSAWTTPQHFARETVVTTTPYRDLANGTVQPTAVNVYGYSFNLNSKKTVQSITLPHNNDVMILAMTLS